jgi:hypothetical protein
MSQGVMAPARRELAIALTAAAVASAALLALALPLTTVAAQDSRTAAIFSSDEEFIAVGVERMLTLRTLDYRKWAYPGAYMNLSAGVGALLVTAGMTIPTAAVVGPRLVSVLGLVFTLFAMSLLTLALTRSGAWAAVAVSWLATVSDLFELGVTAHPDTLQLGMLCLSLTALTHYAQRERRTHLVASAAFAGVAFATKYAGAFLMPVIGLTAAWIAWRRHGTSLRAARSTLLVDAPIALVTFAVFALVTSPLFVTAYKGYRDSLKIQNAVMVTGHTVAESRGGSAWLAALAEPGAVGIIGVFVWLLVSVLLLAALVRAVRERRPEAVNAALLVIVVENLLWLGFLWTRVRVFEVRYALPLVPGIIALAVAAGARLTRHLRAGRPRWIGFAILVLLLLSETPAGLSQVAALAATRAARATHPCLAVAAWTREQIPAGATLVYDQYSYAPPTVAAHATWGLQLEELGHDRAQYVITNSGIRERYRDPTLGKAWRFGEAKYLNALSTYAALERGELPYTAIGRFPECQGTVIYRYDGSETPRPPGP